MLEIDDHFGRGGHDGLLSASVEKVDTDRTGLVIVNHFRVVLFISEFNQCAVVRAFRRVAMLIVAMTVVVGSHGRGGW